MHFPLMAVCAHGCLAHGCFCSWLFVLMAVCAHGCLCRNNIHQKVKDRPRILQERIRFPHDVGHFFVAGIYKNCNNMLFF